MGCRTARDGLRNEAVPERLRDAQSQIGIKTDPVLRRETVKMAFLPYFAPDAQGGMWFV